MAQPETFCLTLSAMRISPKYSVGDWKKIKFTTSKDWKMAVDIFEDRLRGRFLDVIEDIQGGPWAGFAVLALDCLLIETLEQFRKGIDETPHYKVKEYFVQFLTQPQFTGFTNKRAEKFYQTIRNGILHKAETKGSSIVVAGNNKPLVEDTSDGNGLQINRTKFHRCLIQAFEAYITGLKDPSNTELRNNFRKKMDYICRLNSL